MERGAGARAESAVQILKPGAAVEQAQAPIGRIKNTLFIKSMAFRAQ